MARILIENITKSNLKNLADIELQNLRSRFMNIHTSYFLGNDIQKAIGMERKEFLTLYLILCNEMQYRNISFIRNSPLDKEVCSRIVKSSFWQLDVHALGEIVVIPNYVTAIGAFLRSAKTTKEIEVNVRCEEKNRNAKFEIHIGKLVEEHTGKKARFVYDIAGPSGSYIPLFDLVLKSHPETRKVRAPEAKKDVFIKKPLENNKKINKNLNEEGLKTFEYLIHHVEVEGDEEIVHHCHMYDHIGNLFEQAHLYFDKSKVYLDGKEIKEGHYHVIKGLEPKQEVAWSEEEATAAGVKPKGMMSGMTLKEKAKVW